MNRLIYCMIVSSLILAFGFLRNQESRIHKDYNIINSEIQKIGEEIYVQEGYGITVLKIIAKKSRKYDMLVPNYEEFAKNARLVLSSPKTFRANHFNLELYQMQNQGNSFGEKAFAAEETKLAKYYLQLALNTHLQSLIAKNKNSKHYDDAKINYSTP